MGREFDKRRVLGYNVGMVKELEAEKKQDWVDKFVIWWCKVLHLTKYEKILRQMAKFVITGVIATAIDWAIFYVLVYLVQMDPLIAQIFSFLFSTLFNYYSNTKWVFDTTKNKTRRRLVTEFFILSAIGLGISEALLALFINVLSVNDMLAKVITTAIVMVFNFVTRKLFLEERKK